MAKAHNVAGTVAMARTSDPQSASAQFFINVADNRRLDPTFIPPGDPVPEFEYNGECSKTRPAPSCSMPASCLVTRSLVK